MALTSDGGVIDFECITSIISYLASNSPSPSSAFNSLLNFASIACSTSVEILFSTPKSSFLRADSVAPLFSAMLLVRMLVATLLGELSRDF